MRKMREMRKGDGGREREGGRGESVNDDRTVTATGTANPNRHADRVKDNPA